MYSKAVNVTFTFAFSKIQGFLNNYHFIHDIKIQKVRNTTLRDSLLKIFIKGSFTQDFYPLKAFSSDEMKIFLVQLWVFILAEKIKNNTSRNGRCNYSLTPACAVNIYDRLF